MWTAKDARRSRLYTTQLLAQLLEMVEEGLVDKDSLIADLLGWMSEHEVEQFVRRNDLLEALNIEEDEDE